MRNIDAIHPGITLQEDFIEPFHLTANRLAKILGVPQNRISEICRGRRGISAPPNFGIWNFITKCGVNCQISVPNKLS